MTELATNQEKATESKTFKIVRIIVCSVALALLGITVIMAAGRKFNLF